MWDWNGTLLDDLSIVVEAVNRTIGVFGVGPITVDGYRDHYTRPVRVFYDSLFGRGISDEEWLHLNATFHETYFDLAAYAELAHDAREAMDIVARHGLTQSLLSMSPQNWLDEIVSRLGLADRFEVVDGLEGATGGLKAQHMVQHLDLLDLDGQLVAVIGDTPDDVAAARHVSAAPIAFHGGSHHREVLEEQGAPIAESLADAARMAVSSV